LILSFSKLAPLVFLGLASCPQTQTAPVAGATSSVASSLASKTERPWNNPATTPSPPSQADLTAPINAAMMLCSHVLNLTPCGLVTSSANDVMVCFSGCQTQIETVVGMTVERAALECAAAPQKEDAGARGCALHFPEGAAIDAPAIGKMCDERCEALAAREPR
jgi:hypothetical protein